jgi:membrane-bound serine protease (ClpP class)
MTLRAARRVAVVLMLGAGAAPLAAQAVPASPSPAAVPVVYTAVVDAIIHPVSAEFMIRTMDRADRDGASLVVFTLRTPGGLVDSTRDIVSRILASKTPIAVFVGPAGARAASAGFILTLAADVAAMAPGTHIGAAHPVQAGSGGEKPDAMMAEKAANDVAAYVRTLATGRRRNVALAEEAVRSSRAFTEQEAMSASPPLVDLIVPTVAELLQKLDGRSVRRFDGATTTLALRAARVEAIEMSQRQRILSAIAHPNIAFMLLSLGILGLTIELWTPGAIVPGVVGGIALLLAFFALQLLPVNYAGLLLILLGLGLFALEIKVTSYGLLTAGGIVSLLFGAMILIDAPEPDLRLSLRFVVPVTLAFAGIAAFLVRLAVGAQRQRAVTGPAGMIGAAGQALSAIGPGGAGQIRVFGEIWRATSVDPIVAGDCVRIVSLEGLTAIVRRTESSSGP